MSTTYTLPLQWDALAIKGKTDEAGYHETDTDLSAIAARLPARMTTAGIVEGLEVSLGDNFDVKVAGGVAAIDGEDPGQGRYLVEIITGETALVVPEADVSFNRTDRLFLVVRDDQFDSSGFGYAAFAYVTGTPGAGAPDPEPSWKAFLPLATIQVQAGALTSAGLTVTPIAPYAASTLYGGGNPGDIVMTGAGSAAPGWLLCQGQEVAVDDYPRLFAAIGTTFGTPSEPGKFKLPDFRGRWPIGFHPTSSGKSGVTPALGQKGGGLLYRSDWSSPFEIRWTLENEVPPGKVDTVRGGVMPIDPFGTPRFVWLSDGYGSADGHHQHEYAENTPQVLSINFQIRY